MVKFLEKLAYLSFFNVTFLLGCKSQKYFVTKKDIGLIDSIVLSEGIKYIQSNRFYYKDTVFYSNMIEKGRILNLKDFKIIGFDTIVYYTEGSEIMSIVYLEPPKKWRYDVKLVFYTTGTPRHLFIGNWISYKFDYKRKLFYFPKNPNPIMLK